MMLIVGIFLGVIIGGVVLAGLFVIGMSEAVGRGLNW